MYPEELTEFIKNKNYRLGGDDLLKAISIKENPQLSNITFNCSDNCYSMWDRYGNYYSFSAIPFNEISSNNKKLIKKK